MVKLAKVATNLNLILTSIFLNGLQVHGGEHNVNRHIYTVMCYMQGWARYREGDGHFDATSFDPNLCTHLVYYRLGLNNSTYQIESLDPNVELNADEGGQDGFKSITNLKTRNPNLKILMAVGGWLQGSKIFSEIADSTDRRRTFVDSVVALLNKYKLDGLELDWKTPTKRGGKPEDEQNFVTLLKDLKSAFKKTNRILSVMLSGPVHVYELPQISQIVDFINMMTYDIHGHWDKKTGHNSPLYQRNDGHEAGESCNDTIQRFIALGANRRKMNLGVPIYGRTFTLDDPKNNTVGAPANREGPKFNWTQQAGLIGYNELCRELMFSWSIKRDLEQHVPYAFKGDMWISYDDSISIREKVEYAVSNYLSGVVVFAIDMDDVKGRCHSGTPMYLLTAINEVFEKAYIKSLNVKPQHVDDLPQHRSLTNDASSMHCSLITTSTIILSWMLHILTASG